MREPGGADAGLLDMPSFLTDRLGSTPAVFRAGGTLGDVQFEPAVQRNKRGRRKQDLTVATKAGVMHKREPLPESDARGACQGCGEMIPSAHLPLIVAYQNDSGVRTVLHFCCAACLVLWVQRYKKEVQQARKQGSRNFPPLLPIEDDCPMCLGTGWGVGRERERRGLKERHKARKTKRKKKARKRR